MTRRLLFSAAILISCGLLVFICEPSNLAKICDANSNFMPHGFCLKWDPLLLESMIGANLGIAIAYFSIPLSLWYFVRKRKDLPYAWVFRLFAMFIIACGMTHLMKICTLYKPWYWAEASLDIYTGIISLITALALWPLIPQALTLKSPVELEEANRRLERLIAEKEEVTAELKAQAELLELAHDAIVVRDANGIIRYWNSGAKEVYGYTEVHALGRNYYDLLKTEFLTQRNTIDAALLTKGRWEGELVDHRADGSPVSIASRQALKTDASGTPIAILTINSDITEHKRAEQRKLALAQMERTNTNLEQFAFIASHDLQEPLRSIAVCLQMLEKLYKDKLDTTAVELIAHAVDGAVRMRDLINDLLALSRIDNEEAELKSTNLLDILNAALENLAVPIKETGANFTHGELPSLTVNKTQLVQVFQNILNNAIKFHGDQPPQIHIDAKQTNEGYLISIHDNGIGLKPEYAEQIFQPFKRLHSRDQYPGTGIGLAICKRIIEKHGGSIWVESESNEGATFYFTIVGGLF